MRSLAGKLSLRKKKDSPSKGPPIICGLAIPEQVGEYQEREKIAYSQNSQVLSRSFSRTQTVSQDKNTGSGRVEVTSTWNYKTAGSNQFGPDESPYGVMELPTFGSQWGMAISKNTEETQSPYGNAEISLFESQYGVKSSKAAKNIAGAYGKADVSLYGPQYGLTALSPDDDLYGDSDEERRNNKHLRKLTTVQVVEVSTEVEAGNATMNPSPNTTIAQGLYSRLMSINKKNDIAYEGSDKETKPKAAATLTQSATAFPHLQQDSSFHQVIPLSSQPKQISRSYHDTGYNSLTLMDEPIDPFADLRGPISSYGDIDVAFTTKIGPKSCIICTEDFSALLKPPPWITISCTHEPSVCCGCMALCIKSDLENKIWNQITCPECKTLLVYEDIQRLADPGTFAKYEVLSFRNAIGKDENFIWCQQCDFGQLHTGGNEQPIVRCMKCGSRSCFRHTVPWHDRLTCQEYDEMMNDPDGFKSAIERDDEAAAFALKQQHEADERMARELEAQDRREEENRQKAAHEEELRIAREAQAAEAERKRLEKEAEEERKRIEKEAQERAKRLEEIKRRKLQEELSLMTVESTTKKCPGCGWPIEKNHGCSHMTCMSSVGTAWEIIVAMAPSAADEHLSGIKCRSEFCWSCLNDYKAIRKLGNSEHKPTCKFHSDNLPDLDDEDVDRGEDSDSDSDTD